MTTKRGFLVKQLIEKLTILKGNPFSFIEFNVSNVLYTIYEISTSKIELEKDEEIIIGHLIYHVIKLIDTCIFNIGYNFEPNHAANHLILRRPRKSTALYKLK